MLKHWCHYYEGSREVIKILTDHDNLKGFLGVKSLNERQAQWAMKIAAYDFIIKHKAGKLNPVNALSCWPDYNCIIKIVSDMLSTLHSKLALVSIVLHNPSSDDLQQSRWLGISIVHICAIKG